MYVGTLHLSKCDASLGQPTHLFRQEFEAASVLHAALEDADNSHAPVQDQVVQPMPDHPAVALLWLSEVELGTSLRLLLCGSLRCLWPCRCLRFS